MIKRKTISIIKPFYSAGSEKQFNWKVDGFATWGVGIDTKILDKFDSLDIIISKERYRVSTKKAKEFIERYNSYYKVRNYNKTLGVFSMSIMINLTAQAMSDKEENDRLDKERAIPYIKEIIESKQVKMF